MSSASEPLGIVFDLDGTLLPTMEGFARIAAQVISRRRGWEVEEARRAYIRTSGIPFFQQLEVLFPGHEDNGRAAEIFEERKRAVFDATPVPPPVKETLRELKGRGHPMAVSSGNFQSLVRRKIREELPGVFQVVCGYATGFAKGPDHFCAIRRRFGLPPHRCVFVGDSLSDGEKARAFGFHFVGVEGLVAAEEFQSVREGTVVASGVAELPNLLERALGRAVAPAPGRS